MSSATPLSDRILTAAETRPASIRSCNGSTTGVASSSTGCQRSATSRCSSGGRSCGCSRRLPRRETLLPNFYQIGVLSLPVVALTGTFIGMVLAVQSYVQFRQIGLETRLGAVINMSLVRELGPVLAATMLAGRVGSAMAAELGTMRVTEQIDALEQHGRQSDPLPGRAAVPGLPAADSRADDHGRLHGRRGRRTSTASSCWASIGTTTWRTRATSSAVSTCSPGVFKSLFFGAAIALISCYRGFHCDPGPRASAGRRPRPSSFRS